MSSEALDISSLNAVILATPRRKVEQSTGRILRKEKGKYLVEPLIVDIVDSLRPFTAQSYGRKTYYKKITKNENILVFKYNNGEVVQEEKTIEKGKQSYTCLCF
jgi:predicted helicase